MAQIYSRRRDSADAQKWYANRDFKECRTCGVTKAIEEFYVRRGTCIECHKVKVMEREEARKDDPIFREQRRNFSLKHKFKTKYGMTLDDYEQMNEAQDGRCLICDEIPPKRLFVDHDHATGRVRGLLCEGCNFALGYMRDNPERLEAAARYLRGAESFQK